MSDHTQPGDAFDLPSALAEAARTINQPRSVEETLDAIVRTARTSVPGFDAVGISLMHADGMVETKAATDDLVIRLDSLQYELGEGPCVSSLREEPVLVASHLSHQQRWPRYVPQAVDHGVRSQMALRLYVDDEGTMGGINLYSTSSDTVPDDALAAAQVFAAQAAVTLGRAQEVDQLNQALLTRQQIGTALGIIIERYGLDEAAAFAFLTRLSSHSNTKLRDVAVRVVEDAIRARDSK